MIIKIQCHHKKSRPLNVAKADANKNKQELNELLKLHRLENIYQLKYKDGSYLNKHGTRTLS